MIVRFAAQGRLVAAPTSLRVTIWVWIVFPIGNGCLPQSGTFSISCLGLFSWGELRRPCTRDIA